MLIVCASGSKSACGSILKALDMTDTEDIADAADKTDTVDMAYIADVVDLVEISDVMDHERDQGLGMGDSVL